MRFEQKVIVVTGGGGEIGRATALRFARERGTVVVADSDESRCHQVAREIADSGGRCWSRRTDVTERSQVEALAGAVVERYQRIDVLCNIAGIAPPAPLLETSDELWQKTLGINLTGVFLCTQAVARIMVRQGGGGCIVNMASTNGLVGEVGLVAYNASKFGVVGLTMTAALELAPHKIRVNAVAPGMIRTKLSQAVLDADPELGHAYLKDKIPMARFGEPDEVAATVAFLASDDASFITGHALVIDGGQLAL
ncbi:MAG TPA: SDR family NAD(P)-dependent oxidoreductase [Polyangiaceae bacterium]|jgi:3-oxoacyl-[acyl-carrier protein] reductase